MSGHLKKHHWGRMWVTRPVDRCWDGELVAIDNGAYSCWQKGIPYDPRYFLRRVEDLLNIPRPARMVAVLPDIPTEGAASLEFSLDWRSRLPDELPWYLAVQDGMTWESIKDNLAGIKGLFLGGSDKFKTTAQYWCEHAHRNGLFFHYGRASTPGRVAEARMIGADSADSALPVIKNAHGKFGFVRQWLSAAKGQDKQRRLF